MGNHELICNYQPGGTPSTHTCTGCSWEVTTMTKPCQATAAAVQTAYNKHLDPAAGLDDGAD